MLAIDSIQPSQPRQKRCPHCGVVVFQAGTSSSATLPGEKPWFFNNELVPGLSYQWPKGPPCSAETALLLGGCWFCDGSYFVIQITLVTGRTSALMNWSIGGARPVVTEKRSARLSKRQLHKGLPIITWLRSEYVIAAGVVHVHTIGPFELSPIPPGSTIPLREARRGGTTWRVNAAISLVESLWPMLATDFVAAVIERNRAKVAEQAGA